MSYDIYTIDTLDNVLKKPLEYVLTSTIENSRFVFSMFIVNKNLFITYNEITAMIDNQMYTAFDADKKTIIGVFDTAIRVGFKNDN